MERMVCAYCVVHALSTPEASGLAILADERGIIAKPRSLTGKQVAAS